MKLETLKALNNKLSALIGTTNQLIAADNADFTNQHNKKSLVTIFDTLSDHNQDAANRINEMISSNDIIVTGTDEAYDNDANGNDHYRITAKIGKEATLTIQYGTTNDGTGWSTFDETATFKVHSDADIAKTTEQECQQLLEDLASDIATNCFFDNNGGLNETPANPDLIDTTELEDVAKALGLIA